MHQLHLCFTPGLQPTCFTKHTPLFQFILQWFYVAVREIQCMRATLLQKGNYWELRELFNVGK